MHEEVIGDCVFCCGGGDALQHYLVCDHLWTLLVSCAGLKKEWLNLSAAQRLGFERPGIKSYLLIIVALKVYHAMKARRDAGLHDANATGEECSWAFDLINHYFSELPSKLRRALI